MASIEERLQGLERAHRRLMAVAVAAALTVACAGCFAAARVRGPLRASGFLLVDANGKTLASLTSRDGVVSLDVGQRGAGVAITPNGVTVTGPFGSAALTHDIVAGPTLVIKETHSGAVGAQKGDTLTVESDDLRFENASRGWADFGDAFNAPLLSMGAKPYRALAYVSVDDSHATMRLDDGAGFTMDLGNSVTQAIKTGTTTSTSAASIIMFGNDKQHKVIWQAPN